MAGAAATLLTILTRDGALINADSVRYIMGAENLALGNGYVRLAGDGSAKPIVGFPPGYSMILSPSILVGIDKLTAVRILSILFFGLNTYISGWLVYRYSRRIWLGLLVSLAFVVKSSVIKYHYMAASEPVYVLLSLLSILVLAEYLKTAGRRYFFLLVVILGFTPLVRYNGINLMPLAVFSILFLGREPWMKRMMSAVFAAVFSIMPLGLWMGRNVLLSGSSTNRTFMYHPIPPLMLVEYVDEGISWFIPRLFQLSWRPRLSHLAMFLLFIILIIIISEAQRLRQISRLSCLDEIHRILPLFSLGFITSHLFIVLASTSFLDATMSAYTRYMMPAYVFTVILFGCILSQMLNKKGVIRAAGGFGVVLWIALSGFYIQESITEVIRFREENNFRFLLDLEKGAGDYLSSLSTETVLISDDIDLVYLLSGRYAFMIPIRIDNYTQMERDDYSEQLASFHQKMENGAVLMLTNHFINSLNDRYAPFDVLTDNLEIVHQETIVTIYRHSNTHD